ncbi:PREDICTED: homeobox and leucine zipper protein Homez [Nanorana parkeri]|uniref:homeobox and leucine zipper protein Homez n=1 Tax=Nanorana parkeri TaxID=125878 RepID=UPI0008546551|nr:PREDICTED: homeobox and leucine zipper protein Homez [Nanorana parkeri]
MPPTSTKASALYPDDISGFLCLPPASDDLQVIWSRAELTEELDDNPQLISTFSFFPYPSMPEIALLSLRFGLQMEKVKNWFMVQRIRCGISWTPEEIEETRARLNYNHDQFHFKPLIALAKKSNVLRSDEFSIPALKARARQAMASRSCTSPVYNAPESKRIRLSCKLPDKEPLRANESTSVHRLKGCSRDFTSESKPNSLISNAQPKKRQEPDKPVKPSAASLMLGVDGREMNSVSYYPSEEEQMSSSWHMSNGEGVQVSGYIDQNGNLRREDSAPGMRRQRKSKQQLQILKSFFLKCQWATREDYMRLEEITGLPRADIIQWFGDTRYALKHGQLRWFRNSMQEHPTWLDDSQHVGNVNGRQSDGGSPVHAMSSAMTEVPDDDDDDVIASSSQHSGNTVVSEEISDDEPTFSGKSKPGHKVSNFKLLVKNCSKPKTPQGPISSLLQKKYDVLENYLCVNSQFHAQDLEELVTESGLSHQQVLNWFSCRSKDPDEVEICVVEDEDDDDFEDDDDNDVVIQD